MANAKRRLVRPLTPLRAAIVGGGWIARRHVPALDASDGVELVAACDAELGRAEAIALPRGGRAYQRWEDLLEREEPDVLWVCTPPLAHRAPTVAALELGVHVFLEKPIARTLADAEAIVDSASASAAICAVGYQWHASELVDDLREAVAGQSIALLVGRNFGPVAARPWFMDPVQGGGQILERGSHHVDIQRAIAGEIASVQAMGSSVGLAQAGVPSRNIDDVSLLVFHFESGALGTVHMAWTREAQPELYALDVIASEATIAIDFDPVFRLQGISQDRRLDVARSDPFERSIARFLDAVRTGERARVFCTPADAKQTLAVAIACEQARADGGVVQVSR
jgi:predicted dehydrogenase